MARMPGAKWSGEHSPRNKIQRYDIVCIHTIVGYAPAHAAHFSTSGGGTIWQSRDTKYRSAANLNGNHRIIAIENADHGAGFPKWSGDNVPPFTPQQIESIAKICAWAHKTHGIPLVACPNSKPGSRGIAYHRQGIDGNFSGYRYGGRVPGGEVWTEAYGKVCPGDARIAQIPQIIARARQLAGLDSSTPTNPEKDWFDMATKKDLEDVILKALASPRGQEFMANAFAKALRDGPVARREVVNLVLTALRSNRGVELMRSLIAMAFRDSNPLRREVRRIVWDTPVAGKEGNPSYFNAVRKAE